MHPPPNRRILVVDDTPSIHEDFCRIFQPQPADPSLSGDEAILFGKVAPAAPVFYDVHSAYQGREALAHVLRAKANALPYAVAFVDMRMPPGWDGIETIKHLWQEDEALQIVICTAYSDFSWDQMLDRLDARDRLIILRKPFDAVEVLGLASSLIAKWEMARQ